ncbi:MAG TPA: sulfatase [Isosphaeraceae bacterium]|nr:sulfatase [Isosphaeraceae bacterium]
MKSPTRVIEEAGATSERHAATGLGPRALLALSAWCGLVAGLLEVGAIVLRKRTYDPNHLYGMSRHFVWLIPAVNLCLFLASGVLLCLAMPAWPRRGSWLARRLLCALTILPTLLVAFPQVYGIAWLVVALGIASQVVPVLERHAGGFRRLVRASFPVVAGLVPVLAGCLWGSDWIKTERERARPLPPPGAPNVLLIVLDTVAADHLDLHGYGRPTSPTLDELAVQGIRFDGVQAASTWTLPSHASLFTGRWPHELSANWLTPLDATAPTVAEFLGARGYATAGFVANTLYCAADSGLGRGFTNYCDFLFPRLTPFKPAVLVERCVGGLQALEQFLEDRLDFDGLRPAVQHLWWLVHADRKDAAAVNREFLDWLAQRPQPERPFFAFLNYYDAHYPYQLPELSIRRFGVEPRDRREADLIQNWWQRDKRGLSAQEIGFVRDAYDDCVANLDEHLGRLIDELGRRGVRDRTWLIVASDHGESFGEHAGVFCHGTSLYQTELHVPLILVPPKGSPAPRVVPDTVSLRDLAATIVDLVGLEAGSPFPGESLARFWSDSAESPRLPGGSGTSGRALAEVVPNDPQLNPARSRLLEPLWPLAALTEGDWSYIRREGEVREELFHLHNDPRETHNLTADPALLPRLEQMRETLSQLTAGPLTPRRYHP